MRPPIITLRQFYSSILGRKVRQRLQYAVRHCWAELNGEPVVGIGYATPLLRALERPGKPISPVVALMPLEQGAMYWPVHGDNKSVLADVMRPPFAPQSLSRVMVVHALEYMEKPADFLSVLWELLAPGGKVIFIVPNRTSIWARAGHTPFSSGTPYRMQELRSLMTDARFTLRYASTALFSAPSAHPLWVSLWVSIEWLGRWIMPGLGGVLVLEVEKQIYAAVGERHSMSSMASWAPQRAPMASPKNSA